MACPAVITGDRFLERSLAHIDCQAQSIGAYGFQSLAQPGSTAQVVVTGLLTVFIALFGIRLLFSTGPSSRDVLGYVIQVGIVLTLAFSWPAVRTVIYDVALSGPGEVAAAMTGETTVSTEQRFASRLQAADDAIVSLTITGTGRNTGAFVDDIAEDRAFDAAVLEDESTLGWARLTFLTGVLAPLATLRILAGLLLAALPLVAALLLFDATRGIFAGWMRGLVLVFFGSLGTTLVLAVQLAVLQPWLEDALRVRALGYATPAAPIELFALNLMFALASLGVLYVLVRVAFQRGWISLPSWQMTLPPQSFSAARSAVASPELEVSRAQRVSDHLRQTIRRENETAAARNEYRNLGAGGAVRGSGSTNQPSALPSGSSRSSSRSATANTRSGQIRDRMR